MVMFSFDRFDSIINEIPLKFRVWDRETKVMLDWYNYHEDILSTFPIDSGDEWTERFVKMQFSGFYDIDNVEIYSGDAVSFLANRRPEYSYSPQSQYDKNSIEARGIIIFAHGEWTIDMDNPWNDRIVVLKGKETDKRRISAHQRLRFYSEFKRTFRRIKVIGNIYTDFDLLK